MKTSEILQFWGDGKVYRKRDRAQMTIDGFVTLFGGKLSADNRWVRLTQIMPWDMIEDIYSASFKDENTDGRPPYRRA